ncbi:MAG: hypothetical protein AB4911_05615 [Oscillochloridaceae bacterium umkhey_bin13]
MRKLLAAGLVAGGAYLLWRWYEYEATVEYQALISLQSEHEHFHLHVDLPPGVEIEPGDTVEILDLPNIQGQTRGEIVYPSPVRFSKASWLRRTLIKRSSLIEVNELVDHP